MKFKFLIILFGTLFLYGCTKDFFLPSSNDPAKVWAVSYKIDID